MSIKQAHFGGETEIREYSGDRHTCEKCDNTASICILSTNVCDYYCKIHAHNYWLELAGI